MKPRKLPRSNDWDLSAAAVFQVDLRVWTVCSTTEEAVVQEVGPVDFGPTNSRLQTVSPPQVA
ncbi:hypothetical protein ACIGW4_29275 [Streptomyces sp. NPDC053513]|uniref:hypothetical protein n=1 Tax=unclassified Streptomyces TaxID=2593676 RepID=UPI0037D44E3D